MSSNSDQVVSEETEKVTEPTAPPSSEQVSISLQDVTPLQAIDVVYKLLNKAASAGVYSIDESHALKILVTKVANALAVAAANADVVAN